MSTYVIDANAGRSILNDFVIFKLAGAQTAANLAIVEHVLAPGELGAPMHTHSREDEYSFVLEGKLSAVIGGELVVAGPGGLVLKPRGIPHTFFNQGARPLRILELIAPGDFAPYFDELAELVIAGGGRPDGPALIALAARYGLEMDLASMGSLIQAYGVHPRGNATQPEPAGEPL
jgi:mannose-6-phosphate isomerase-like protein (cupin superfamily)